MPVLGVFGGKDVQVVAEQNAPLMEAQLADGHPASRVVTLPDANHLFQAAGTGSVAEYGTLEPVVHARLPAARRRAGSRSRSASPRPAVRCTRRSAAP